VAAYSIYSQPPSIAAGRSSIRNLRKRHAVGTGTHKTWIAIMHNMNISVNKKNTMAVEGEMIVIAKIVINTSTNITGQANSFNYSG
jgi:hypothetical protein